MKFAGIAHAAQPALLHPSSVRVGGASVAVLTLPPHPRPDLSQRPVAIRSLTAPQPHIQVVLVLSNVSCYDYIIIIVIIETNTLLLPGCWILP